MTGLTENEGARTSANPELLLQIEETQDSGRALRGHLLKGRPTDSMGDAFNETLILALEEAKQEAESEGRDEKEELRDKLRYLQNQITRAYQAL